MGICRRSFFLSLPFLFLFVFRTQYMSTIDHIFQFNGRVQLRDFAFQAFFHFLTNLSVVFPDRFLNPRPKSISNKSVLQTPG